MFELSSIPEGNAVTRRFRFQAAGMNKRVKHIYIRSGYK